MADNPEYDDFADFYSDPEIQKQITQIRKALSCNPWQAMVVLLLTQHDNLNISIQPPPDDDDPWKH